MIERRKPEPLPGGGWAIFLAREPKGWDEFHLPALGTERAITVGPGAGISRVYVEVMKQQGWEGTEDIPREFIVDP